MTYRRRSTSCVRRSSTIHTSDQRRNCDKLKRLQNSIISCIVADTVDGRILRYVDDDTVTKPSRRARKPQPESKKVSFNQIGISDIIIFPSGHRVASLFSIIFSRPQGSPFGIRIYLIPSSSSFSLESARVFQ